MWKAADFKLFFFHLGPLLLFEKFCSNESLVESFLRLSVAIRLFSEKILEEKMISYAENQLNMFLNLFINAFSAESQSFNFHALRHLPTQVKDFGPLWLYSAFSYESANHLLIRTVSGSIKTPEKIADNFLVSQFNETISHSKSGINADLYTKLSQEALEFAKVNKLSNFQSRFDNGTIFTSEAYTYHKKIFQIALRSCLTESL